MEFRALGRQRNSKLNIRNKSTVSKKGRPCEGELVPSSFGPMLSESSSLWIVGSDEAELLEIREAVKPSQPAAPTSDQTETLTLLRRHRMERPPHGAPPPSARLALQPWIPSRESLLQPGAEVPRCRGDLKTGQVLGALKSEDHKTTGVRKCADLSLPPPLHCVGNPGQGWNYNSRQALRQGPSGQPE